jgi:predicted cupin superfamily sugar epimerase
MAAPDEAEALIAALGLAPHPEGGHYREIYRHRPADAGRGAATTIYYLLKAGERSAWHRIDAVEIWHHYAGGALSLAVSVDGMRVEIHRLGKDIAAGERPVAIVPPHGWQSAAPIGAYALVGCTVAPAFEFARFEMAPPEWQPGMAPPRAV